MNDINKTQEKKALNKKATIAGIFYIFVQLLVRGISFIATPIYSRLVSKAQYGELRVFESWLSILVPILSLSMYKSVARAKYDFREDYAEYISSVQGLSYLIISISYLFVTLFFREQIKNFIGINDLLYVFMILYTYSHASFLYFQARESQMLRYKQSVLLSTFTMVPATLLSIALLYLGNRKGALDELVNLRVIGYYTPQIICGLLVAFLMFRQGGFSINKKYWKYAVLFSLPLIPETLSILIMNQADKIMIQKLVGNEFTGVFSLAATISFIIWILEDATWHAFMPWLFEKLDRGEIDEIQKPWDYLASVFGFFSWALVILAPELIYIMGGKKYSEAVYLVAPMVTGTLFRMFSYSFTAIENYQRKTTYCALGSAIAMLTNLTLNYIMISNYGYQAAAYTTAFSYFVLMVIQGFFEKKVCGTRCVSLKKTILMSVLFLMINELTVLTYSFVPYIRWIIFVIAAFLVMWYLWPKIIKILKELRR